MMSLFSCTRRKQAEGEPLHSCTCLGDLGLEHKSVRQGKKSEPILSTTGGVLGHGAMGVGRGGSPSSLPASCISCGAWHGESAWSLPAVGPGWEADAEQLVKLSAAIFFGNLNTAK